MQIKNVGRDLNRDLVVRKHGIYLNYANTLNIKNTSFIYLALTSVEFNENK